MEKHLQQQIAAGEAGIPLLSLGGESMALIGSGAIGSLSNQKLGSYTIAMQTTRQSLGIFWDGEEVDGITLYGYWNEMPQHFPSICGELGKDAAQECDGELHGKGWYVHIWDIKIDRWPLASEWRQCINNMLRRIIDAGACVAWGGLEGAFVDPPDLFRPEFMNGGVWTAMNKDGVLYFHAELAGEFIKLSDSELCNLRDCVSQ